MKRGIEMGEGCNKTNRYGRKQSEKRDTHISILRGWFVYDYFKYRGDNHVCLWEKPPNGGKPRPLGLYTREIFYSAELYCELIKEGYEFIISTNKVRTTLQIRKGNISYHESVNGDWETGVEGWRFIICMSNIYFNLRMDKYKEFSGYTLCHGKIKSAICKIRGRCKRFLSPPNECQKTYFSGMPFPSGECNFFLGVE